jgi:putative hydrolase of the HAD superfamily
MGIELYFDDVFVSEEMGEEKSERFFRKVATTIRAEPKTCLMVGDREDADIVPAKKAGFLTIRVRRGKHAEGKTIANADIKDLRQMEKILRRY